MPLFLPIRQRFAAGRPVRRHYLHGLQRRNGRNRMFVDKLLPAVVLQNNRKVVETPYQAFKLKTVDKVNDYRDVFFSHLIEETVLQVYDFADCRHIHPSKLSPVAAKNWRRAALTHIYRELLRIFVKGTPAAPSRVAKVTSSPFYPSFTHSTSFRK
jgi:hypothetical protein